MFLVYAWILLFFSLLRWQLKHMVTDFRPRYSANSQYPLTLGLPPNFPNRFISISRCLGVHTYLLSTDLSYNTNNLSFVTFKILFPTIALELMNFLKFAFCVILFVKYN